MLLGKKAGKSDIQQGGTSLILPDPLSTKRIKKVVIVCIACLIFSLKEWKTSVLTCLSSPQTNNVQNTLRNLCPKASCCETAIVWRFKKEVFPITIGRPYTSKQTKKYLYEHMTADIQYLYTGKYSKDTEREKERRAKFQEKGYEEPWRCLKYSYTREEGIIGEPETELLYMSDMDIS